MLEFQADHDPDKLDVMLAEVARLRIELRHGDDRRGKYRVIPGLVYLRGRCPDEVLEMTIGPNCGVRLAPIVWNVAADSLEATLEGIRTGKLSWGMLFWAPLMAGADEPGLIQNWRELAAGVSDNRARADLVRIALVFAELSGRYLLWEKALEDWKMTESPVVNRWMDSARLEEGKENLLRVLRRRFPGNLSADVESCIHCQPNLNLLHEWLDAASEDSSLDEFVAILKR